MRSLLAVALLLATPSIAQAASPHVNMAAKIARARHQRAEWQHVVSLRHAVGSARHEALTVARGVGLNYPVNYSENRTKAAPYLHWLVKLWDGRRARAQARAREIHREAVRAAERAAQAAQAAPSTVAPVVTSTPVAAPAPSGSVEGIIMAVFGSAGPGAINVARCESGFSTAAVNGQYLGIFQMGSNERATYATSGYSTAYEQVVAAHNYYVAAGGWGPWSCQP